MVLIVASSLMDLFSPIWHQTKHGSTSPADQKKDCMTQFPSVCVYRDRRMVPKSHNNLIPAAPSSLLGRKTCASSSSAQEKQLSSVWVCNSCRESSGDKAGLIPTPMTERSSPSFCYDAEPKSAGACPGRFPLLTPLFC